MDCVGARVCQKGWAVGQCAARDDQGGQAGEVYDPCYHQACDRLDNVNRDVLDHYLRAVAGTLARFATSTGELR